MLFTLRNEGVREFLLSKVCLLLEKKDGWSDSYWRASGSMMNGFIARIVSGTERHGTIRFSWCRNEAVQPMESRVYHPDGSQHAQLGCQARRPSIEAWRTIPKILQRYLVVIEGSAAELSVDGQWFHIIICWYFWKGFMNASLDEFFVLERSPSVRICTKRSSILPNWTNPYRHLSMERSPIRLPTWRKWLCCCSVVVILDSLACDEMK